MEKQRPTIIEQIPQKDWEKTPASVRKLVDSHLAPGKLNVKTATKYKGSQALNSK